MNDLEERLRADLESATADIDYAINAADVLQAGRAARRSRTLGRVAAVAAAAVALVGVSTYVAPPLIAQILDHQTIEVNSYFEWDKTRSEFDQMTVTLQSKGGVITATATGERDGAVVATKSWTLPPDNAPMRVPFGSRAVIVIFPGDVQQSEMLLGMDRGSSGASARQWMPSFGVTVVVSQVESSKVRPETLDWVWLDAVGVVHSFDGARGATVTMGGKTYLVYKSPQVDLLGLAGRFAIRLSSVKDADLLVGAVSWGGTEAASWQLGLLPAGAHDVQLKLSKPGGEWAGAATSDGSVIVLVRVPGRHKQVVTSLSYVRADGTLVKYGH